MTQKDPFRAESSYPVGAFGVIFSETIVKVVTSGGTGVLTLAVAIIGLVLAIVSLLWQLFSFRLQGPRLRITLKKGYFGVGNLVSSPIGVDADVQMAAQGLTEKLIGVEVQNVGRMPISIDGATAKLENGMMFTETNLSLNPAIGTRIEPHSTETWWVRWDNVIRMATASAAINSKWQRAQQVRMQVKPAAGKLRETKEHLLVSPHQ
jgi:hypothetical protein